MRARNKEMLQKSVAAMVAAIEIYNKPDFHYREEVFSILSVNAWELLAKAYILKLNKNRLRSIYVFEKTQTKSGRESKKLKVKTNRSGNPITHSLDFCLTRIEQLTKKPLDNLLKKNIDAIVELRDNAIHFLNHSSAFSKKLQEIGSATLKNYVSVIKAWFDYDLSGFNFYLMPLSFFVDQLDIDAVILNREEKRFLRFVDALEGSESGTESPFNITVNINVNFTKAKDVNAIQVRSLVPGEATPEGAAQIVMTEEQIQARYPWTYSELVKRLSARYTDYKQDAKFHRIKNSLSSNPKLVKRRYLDPSSPKSGKKDFYSTNVLQEFDKHYSKK